MTAPPQVLVVDGDDDGRRLDVVVAERLDLSRTQVATRCRDGGVLVDGAVARPSVRVRAGQRIEVGLAAVEVAAPPPPLPPVRYADDHLLVLAKPAGLVVHPGAGHASGTLVDALRAAGTPLAPAGGELRPGIVHRLDRDTSGLLVVARTDAAYAGLVEALRERAVTRRYLALVDGDPAAPLGRIEAPIGRDPGQRTRFATIPEGKPATTRYEVVARGRLGERPVSLLACRLETGRTHQIRVHLDAIGHPVLGDRVYGPRPAMAARIGLTRPFLHAGRLAFDHPVTGGHVDVVEPLPADLVAAARACGIEVGDVGDLLGEPS